MENWCGKTKVLREEPSPLQLVQLNSVFIAMVRLTS